MAYCIDAEKMSLADLRKRIEETDLVPSRISLLDGLQDKIKALIKQGIVTLSDLRRELKNPKRLESVAKAAGIESQYLVLLRREIEGYFPKPFPIKSFVWISKEAVKRLEENGLKNTILLYDAINNKKERAKLGKLLGIDVHVLESLFYLVDLNRIQWVSPIAARMLVDAGYTSTSQVARANAEKLCSDLVRVNEGNKYFKGKIGLRDIKRLVQAANYLA